MYGQYHFLFGSEMQPCAVCGGCLTMLTTTYLHALNDASFMGQEKANGRAQGRGDKLTEDGSDVCGQLIIPAPCMHLALTLVHPCSSTVESRQGKAE